MSCATKLTPYLYMYSVILSYGIFTIPLSISIHISVIDINLGDSHAERFKPTNTWPFKQSLDYVHWNLFGSTTQKYNLSFNFVKQQLLYRFSQKLLCLTSIVPNIAIAKISRVSKWARHKGMNIYKLKIVTTWIEKPFLLNDFKVMNISGVTVHIWQMILLCR